MTVQTNQVPDAWPSEQCHWPEQKTSMNIRGVEVSLPFDVSADDIEEVCRTLRSLVSK